MIPCTRPRRAPRLGDDVCEAARALAAAHVGDDAVGAEVVAAVHDAQPGLGPPRAPHGQALGHDALARLDGEDALMRVARLLIELGEAPELVRAEDEVDDTEALPQLLGHLGPLGHAAQTATSRFGFFALAWTSAPTLPSTRISACSRMAQVLTTIKSASFSFSVKP